MYANLTELVKDFVRDYRQTAQLTPEQNPTEQYLTDKIFAWIRNGYPKTSDELLLKWYRWMEASGWTFANGVWTKPDEPTTPQGGILDVIGKLLEKLWKGFASASGEAVGAGLEVAAKVFFGPGEVFWEGILNALTKMGFLDKTGIDMLNSIKANNPFMRLIAMPVLCLSALQGLMQVITTTIPGDFLKRMAALYTPSVPNAGEIVRAAFIAPEKINDIRRAMAENGLSQADQDLILLANYALYPVDTIKELYWRKILSPEKAQSRLAELGFTPERIDEMMQSWTIIPSPQDLLYMVGREAFEQDEIDKYGLKNEFPEAQVEWLEKMGLSRFWSEKYWISHWQYPAITQVYEMYHRGKITEADMYDFFRVIEIPPYWRKKLMEISYNPLTRVDARRMYDLGVIDEEKLAETYAAEGYNPENVRYMIEFTKKYAADNDKTLTQTQILNGYADKIISKDRAIQMLMAIGYRREDSEYFVAYRDFKEEESILQEQESSIKTLFQENLIDANECALRLRSINTPEARVQILVKKWEINKYVNREKPTKTDLIGFLTKRIIDEKRFREEMLILGYSDSYIDLYIADATGNSLV